jgi:serine/threonine protein kinase
MSEEMKNFISRLLAKNPSERLGVKGAEEVKNDPWFADWNWEKLEKMKMKAPYIPELKPNYEGANLKPQELRSNETLISSSKLGLIDSNKSKFENF